MDNEQQNPAVTLTVTRGNPTPEELAAVTALLTSMAGTRSADTGSVLPAQRVERIRKRRALSAPRLPWIIARR